MLPSKYFHDGKKRDERHMPSSPPLGITGVLCKSTTFNIPGRGHLSYTVYRPRMLSTSKALPPEIVIPPPLICVAGGPGMSSTYLSVIVHGVTDRAIILFDHMGTGQSVSASKATPCTLEHAVSDLHKLLQHLFTEQRPFHLLGHSYGGIVSWEYLQKHQDESSCASLILSNVPFHVGATLERRTKLREELGAHQFLQQHECRAVPMPLPLQQSLESLSNVVQDTTYRTFTVSGTTSIPTMLLLAQYDFVPKDIELWNSSCPNVTIVHLSDCSHYAMIENDVLYNAAVASYVKEHD